MRSWVTWAQMPEGTKVYKNQLGWLPSGRGLLMGAWGIHLWLGEERGRGRWGRDDDSGDCGCVKAS